jgi:hypothetical protein
MSKQIKSYLLAFALITVTLAMSVVSRAQSGPSNEAPKTTEQAFKNIQVLKGLPADQLFPTMQFISASLGVECEFCHVERAFDKDDKKPKEAARKMIRMVQAINKDNFEGHMAVTCNSCHRGSPHPAGIPAVMSEKSMAAMEHGEKHDDDDEKEAASVPADPILEKYLAAVGGADAVRKVTSRVEKGSASMAGHQVPIDIFALDPDKRASVMHMPGGDSVTAFDGHGGWLGNPGHPARPMNSSEADGARLDADLHFPARLKEIFNEFQVGPSEKIGDKDVSLVRALRPGKPPVKLYFDKQSGLLVRMIRYGETPLGLLPAQIDYADYRDSGGVKIPFRWTLARPNGEFTIQVDKAEQNVPVDASMFTAPPPPKPPSQ